ncbi:MAG: glycosyltransferase, partial [Alphaproteobacteria bacterium]
MKVMHVITSLDIGGAEQMLRRLVTADSPHADNRDAVSHSVVTMIAGGPLRAPIEAAGIPVTDLNMTPGAASIAGLWQLTRLIRRQKPDLIQTWLYHADLATTLALQLSGRRRRTPLIWGLRCSDMHAGHATPRHRFILRCLAFLSRRPDLIISNSTSGVRVHTDAGYRPKQWLVIPNGFHTQEFAPNPQQRAKMRAELGLAETDFAGVLCARVAPMKDHQNIVRAAEIFTPPVPHG